MTKLTIVAHDGAKFEIDAEDGSPVMENAIRNSVPGIEAECGGACACAGDTESSPTTTSANVVPATESQFLHRDVMICDPFSVQLPRESHATQGESHPVFLLAEETVDRVRPSLEPARRRCRWGRSRFSFRPGGPPPTTESHR